jgi:DNA transformation protein
MERRIRARMGVSAGFREFVLEQLQQTRRDIHARAMFGGIGIYAGEHFFALIAGDTLYFKVDDQTRPKYTALDMQPFRPYGPDGEEMNYFSVPISVVEDADALRPWVADAVDVAVRAKAKPRRARRVNVRADSRGAASARRPQSRPRR